MPVAEMEAARLLAIACSPRRGGNTDALLEAALDGAREAGSAIERVNLRELTIAPCQHCGGCVREPGSCVIEDDMQALYEPLCAADRIILAAPVFFMGLPAQAKAMIDRCQPLWVLRGREGKSVARACHERAALFLSVGGSQFDTLFDASRLVLAAWYWTLEVFERRELTFRGIDEKGAILRHPTALDEARRVGSELAAWRTER